VSSISGFTIYRDNPNQPVSVILNLSNDTHSTSFDVSVVPKGQHCDSSYDGVAETTTKFDPIQTDKKLTEFTYGSNPNEEDVWAVRLVAPGLVTNVECCEYPDGKDFVTVFRFDIPDQRNKAIYVASQKFGANLSRNPDWQGDTIYLVGMKNGAPRKVVVTAHYKVPTLQCHEVDWPKNEDEFRPPSVPESHR
jgi:hypothetical protein